MYSKIIRKRKIKEVIKFEKNDKIKKSIIQKLTKSKVSKVIIKLYGQYKTV